METKRKNGWDNRTLWFMLGMLLVGISSFLYIFLGQDVVVTYHDQLDGEVLNYIYQAKYLWQGNVIPEFMNGAPKGAMTAPAPLLVLLYKVASPFVAFVLSQYLVILLGFAGMYLLLNKLIDCPFVSMVVGVMFAYLPLLPVYGLSMFGIPLLLWAFWNLTEVEHFKDSMKYNLLIILYGALSSLVLDGFAVLGFWIVASLIYLFTKKKRSYFYIGGLVLLVVYCVCNLELFTQLFSKAAADFSHKNEMVVAATPLLRTLWDTFFYGVEHAKAYQFWIVILAVFTIVFCLPQKSLRKNREWGWLISLFGINMGIAFWVALWNSGLLVALRQSVGGAALYLQLDRVYWLYPASWYLILGLCVKLLYDRKRWLMIPSMVVVAVTSISLLLGGNWKVNVSNLIKQESTGISWQEFYATDVFRQIKTYLQEKEPKVAIEDYRVVSLGIAPAAALYNGFYCLDGYSNNYPLEYKKAFRQIIEPELNKSEYLQNYFDDWGNRCYLLSAEIPGYFTVEKGGFYFSDFSMNTAWFKKMGGRFVFSAAYIENAKETGLELVCEEPFESADSYYKIYLYQVVE